MLKGDLLLLSVSKDTPIQKSSTFGGDVFDSCSEAGDGGDYG
jgi:hypothetical protein